MDETTVRASIEAYVAAWNETDAARRSALLEQACSEDIQLWTPGRRVAGRAALAAMMADFQARRPGWRAAFASSITVQGLVFRYAGQIEGEGAPPAPPGGDTLDTGACSEDGRIALLLTFPGVALPSHP
jgi:SnoaL-like domain